MKHICLENIGSLCPTGLYPNLYYETHSFYSKAMSVWTFG